MDFVFTVCDSAAGEACRQAQHINLGKGRAEHQDVVVPGRAAQVAVGAGVGKVLAFALDLAVDAFLHVVQRVLAAFLEELDAQEQFVLLDVKTLLHQRAHAEAVPAAPVRPDAADGEGHGPRGVPPGAYSTGRAYRSPNSAASSRYRQPASRPRASTRC